LADVNNIFFGAVGLILLHEIAHMSMKHKIELPEHLKLDQENEADQFAASWIFEGVTGSTQREFRILVSGITLWLSRGAVHPSTHQRTFGYAR
jgi:hypothetical protein